MAHVTMIRTPFVLPVDMVNQQVGTPPLGMAYLLGSLKAAGHSVTGIDAFGEGIDQVARLTNVRAKGIQIHGITADQIVELVPDHTDVIGLSCMFSNEWIYTRYVIAKLKTRFPHVPIIAGGEHITAESYRSMLNTPALTACVLGEGEEALIDLVDALMNARPLSEVAGIAYFDEDGHYVKTDRRARNRDIDEIPLPSWDEIPIEKYLDAGLGNGTLARRAIPMLASRGCPYRCTFCSSPSMWGTRWLSRSPRLVIDEIKSYMNRYGVNHIDFQDLTTVINRKWIIEFCQLLIEEDLGISWSLSSGTRSEALDAEVLGYMKRAGIERLTYAPESGSEATLERVQKKVDLENMTRSIRASVKAGIYSRANLIFGLPDQTKYEAFESIRFLTKLCFLGMYDVACMAFAPYPGSYLFEKLVSEDKIKTDDETFSQFLIDNLTTKATGMKSWSKHIPGWSMPLWIVGTTAYFYTLQFILRPQRFVRLVWRMIRGRPTTMIETIVYGLFIKFFRRRIHTTTSVERVEEIEVPAVKHIPRKESSDPWILVSAGNPERAVI